MYILDPDEPGSVFILNRRRLFLPELLPNSALPPCQGFVARAWRVVVPSEDRRAADSAS